LVRGVGIYECDLERAAAISDDRSPDEPEDQAGRTDGAQLLQEVATNLDAQLQARQQPVDKGAIDREVDVTRFQFPPQIWSSALRSNQLTEWSWRCAIAENMRARSWIEAQIKTALVVSPAECTEFYARNAERFALPMRIRARHIFFAAPPGSAPDLVKKKRAAAQGILDRLNHNEKFEDLATESEDEASKKEGGDLSFFSEARMPPDFWAAIKDRRVGEPAAMVQTKLGFHVVEVTEIRPPQPISFEETRPEIRMVLENEKRVAAVTELAARLMRDVRTLKAEVRSE
jgi:parvulin-like peptidyl-prolyl isomerase